MRKTIEKVFVEADHDPQTWGTEYREKFKKEWLDCSYNET